MSKYHKILQISTDANQHEIKRAYRKMVKRYHPDLNSSAEAEAMFLKVDEAYDVLTGKIKPTRKTANIRSTPQYQAREQKRKEDLEKRRAKAKKYAKMRYEKLKEEHDAFMNSPALYLAVGLLFGFSLLLMIVAVLLFFVPILSYQEYQERIKIVPYLEFDYSTFGAWLFVLPILYLIYRVFMEIFTLSKYQ